MRLGSLPAAELRRLSPGPADVPGKPSRSLSPGVATVSAGVLYVAGAVGQCSSFAEVPMGRCLATVTLRPPSARSSRSPIAAPMDGMRIGTTGAVRSCLISSARYSRPCPSIATSSRSSSLSGSMMLEVHRCLAPFFVLLFWSSLLPGVPAMSGNFQGPQPTTAVRQAVEWTTLLNCSMVQGGC